MNYEFSASIKTIKSEGVGRLAFKSVRYFWYIWLGFWFYFQKKPKGDPKKVIDFAFQAAGKIICPYQVESELKKLAAIISQNKPKTILEVGTFRGGTLFVFCSLAAENARIISLDLPGGRDGGGYAFWRRYLFKSFIHDNQKLFLIRGNSTDKSTIKQVKKIIAKRGIDFLFIDGDHSYDGVKKDFENYAHLVNRGGIIAFHDICIHPKELDCHVDLFWKKVKKGKKFLEIIENPKQGWGGIGVLYITNRLP